jgi:hypothetical protein
MKSGPTPVYACPAVRLNFYLCLIFDQVAGVVFGKWGLDEMEF